MLQWKVLIEASTRWRTGCFLGFEENRFGHGTILCRFAAFCFFFIQEFNIRVISDTSQWPRFVQLWSDLFPDWLVSVHNDIVQLVYSCLVSSITRPDPPDPKMLSIEPLTQTAMSVGWNPTFPDVKVSCWDCSVKLGYLGIFRDEIEWTCPMLQRIVSISFPKFQFLRISRFACHFKVVWTTGRTGERLSSFWEQPPTFLQRLKGSTGAS